MRLPALILVLLFVLAAGCRGKRIPVIAEAATDVGLAGVQQELENAVWHSKQAQRKSGRAAEPHFAAVHHSHDRAQEKLVGAATSYDKVRKAALKLDAAYQRCKWIGWQLRHYWHVFLAAWIGLGIVSVVAGLTGFMSISRLITQNLFVMSPFVWVRDWLIRRRNGGENTTTVVVQQPPPTVSVDTPPGATPVNVVNADTGSA